MLRFLALLGGAYALYRRFQGSRPASRPQQQPPAGPAAADQAAKAPPNPGPAGPKTKPDL